MGRHKCEAVACLSSQVKCNFYELLYCAPYLWQINLIWFDLNSKHHNFQLIRIGLGNWLSSSCGSWIMSFITISCCISTLACNMFSVFCSHCDFVDETVLKRDVQWSTAAVHDSQTTDRERERERELISDWIVVVWRTRDPSQSAVAATDTTLSSDYTSCWPTKTGPATFKNNFKKYMTQYQLFLAQTIVKESSVFVLFCKIGQAWCDWEAHSSQTRRSTTWLFCGRPCTFEQ